MSAPATRTDDRPTVAVIDDSAIDLLLYRRILARSGRFGEILTFRGADEALAFLEDGASATVEVILLDINMPRMNGFEFLHQASERLGARFLACVVIMLTTSLDPTDIALSRTFEAVRGYASKPLTVDTLEQVITLFERGGRDDEWPVLGPRAARA